MPFPKHAPLFFLLLLAPAACFASGEWRVVERDDDPDSGYVLSRKFDGSETVAFRLETTLDVPAAAAAGVSRRMTYREADTEPGQKRHSLRIEDDRLLTHVEVDVPFLADRDVVLWFDFRWNEPGGAYIVQWSEATDEGPAPKRGVVRMPRLRGHFTFEPDGHRTRVICETEIDFGGNVPDFLVRSTLPEQMRGVVDDLRQEIATTLASS